MLDLLKPPRSTIFQVGPGCSRERGSWSQQPGRRGKVCLAPHPEDPKFGLQLSVGEGYLQTHGTKGFTASRG